MKLYIDCDGVIFDSEKLIFNEDYYKLENNGLIKTEEDKIKYVQEVDWYKILNDCEVINNSIEVLRSLKRDFTILTKIHSMNNEGVAKVKMFRSLGIKNEIILCPYKLQKHDLVSARENILVDDTINNLVLWEKMGGYPIFFNKDNIDIDGWNSVNTKYKRISSLDSLNNVKKLILK